MNLIRRAKNLTGSDLIKFLFDEPGVELALLSDECSNNLNDGRRS